MTVTATATMMTKKIAATDMLGLMLMIFAFGVFSGYWIATNEGKH